MLVSKQHTFQTTRRASRLSKASRLVRASRLGKASRLVRASRLNRASRLVRASRLDRASRLVRASRLDRASRLVRASRLDRASRLVRASRLDRASRFQDLLELRNHYASMVIVQPLLTARKRAEKNRTDELYHNSLRKNVSNIINNNKIT